MKKDNVKVIALPDLKAYDILSCTSIETIYDEKVKNSMNYEIEFNFSNRNIFDIFRHQLRDHKVLGMWDMFQKIRSCDSFEKPYTTPAGEVKQSSKSEFVNIVTPKVFDIESARKNAEEFLVFTYDDDVDRYSIYALENFRKLLKNECDWEKAIYALPNSIMLQFEFTINITELIELFRNTFNISLNIELRETLINLYFKLPKEHQRLLKDVIPKDIETFRPENKKRCIREMRCKDCSMLIEKDGEMYCDDINKACKDITMCTFNGMDDNDGTEQ